MALILLEISNQVARVTLNRPEKYNAFNREMALLLQDILEECAANNEIRCVLITGKGKAFCAGQDLGEVADPEGPGMEKILKEHYNPLVRKIREMAKPVVAAVNGIAAGAGANIALCCDITVAAHSATFIQAFSKIGLIPDNGGTFFLPRLIGFQRATAYMMMGDPVTAPEAEKTGMIYKCFADKVFEKEVEKITGILAQMPTKALAFTKQALNASMEQPFEAQLHTEDLLQQKAALTEDFKEGVASFLQKRKPQFTGK